MQELVKSEGNEILWRLILIAIDRPSEKKGLNPWI